MGELFPNNVMWRNNEIIKQYFTIALKIIVDGLLDMLANILKGENNFYQIFVDKICLFVCGISLTSGQLIIELFPDCTRSCFSQVVSRRRGGERIYEMRCLFVAVGPNARFIVLPHWVTCHRPTC